NVLGVEVAVLVNEKKEPGTYRVNFSGANLASGTYFYRLQAGAFVQTKKFVLLK
ncbi:MAG: peptidase S8, partial [Ignavibacteria bacterium CG08_land_8_20_14_0_20_37_9]